MEMSALKFSVWILLHLQSQLYYCHCQQYPNVSFREVNLTNHSYVDLSLVNSSASGSVQCHTDLSTCCTSAQGADRGDWYFPNGSRVQLRSGGGDIYQSRDAQRVDLRRRNYGTTSGIYRCFIPTVAVHDDGNISVRDYVYVGLYDSGGDISIIADTLYFGLASISEADTPQFTLTCISRGGPATTVTWTRDSVTVTEGTETVLCNSVTAQYTHTLTVTGREGGLYTCTVANNKPSSDSSSLTVNVASTPDNLSLRQDGEATIIISWTTPTPLGETTGYRVYYNNDSMTKNITVNISTSTMLSLTSLVPGHHYNISIVGLSDHLPSEPVTSSIYLVRLPRKISVIVKDVNTTTISLNVLVDNYNSKTSYNATVTWTVRLINRCNNKTDVGGFHVEGYVPTVEYNITNIYPESDYNIIVTITNAAGSVTSDNVNVTTMTTVPSAPPENITTKTTVFNIRVKWDPVDCIHQNGKIIEYIIKYHPQDREKETMNDTTAMLEFTITDLQPYTVYVIRVAAVDDAGIGVYGNVTAKTTPFEVTVKSKTSTTITLAWSEADYTAMKTVNISWMIDDSLCMYEEDVDGQTTNNTVAPYVITELKAHSSYTITVCVEDLVCESITETTSESVPSAAPATLLLVTQTVSSITVAWEPVPCMHRNGDITGYAVMYRELSSGLATYVHETVTIRNIDITGLKPSTLYEIAVAAFNSVGTGPFTNASFKTDSIDVTFPSSRPTISATIKTDSIDPSSSPTISIKPDGSDNLCTDCSAAIAVLAVSLALNITLATVILILILRIMRRSASVVLHSSKEMYAVPSVHLDVPVTPNEAYALHQSSKPSEDTMYEMVK